MAGGTTVGRHWSGGQARALSLYSRLMELIEIAQHSTRVFPSDFEWSGARHTPPMLHLNASSLWLCSEEERRARDPILLIDGGLRGGAPRNQTDIH